MATCGLVLALATTMGMVDRVHNGTADGRTNALPAVTTGLTDLDVGMLGVSDLADGGAAGEQHATHLRRGHTQDGVLAFLTHQLDGGASGTSQSGTLAGLQLNGMDERTDRDLGEGHSIAGLDVLAHAGHDHVSNLQALGVKDVALLTVHVVQQSNTGGTVGVVLDGSDLGGHEW